MSKSYTPGLKILKNTKILKERRLPLIGDINCKIGDQVKNDTIVASTSIPGNIHMVIIVRQLNIDAQSVKDYLTVKIDQKIIDGTANLTQFISGKLRKTQSGIIQNYLLGVLGILVVIIIVINQILE